MIREYLKLARLSIAPLTGLAPVLGYIATGQYQIFYLVILFFIGVLGHAYGITHNDIIDYNLDKNIKDFVERPLVSGTITKQKAWIFALGCLFLMFVFAAYLTVSTQKYYLIIFLAISVICVTLYNLISKKIPLADSILAIGMFFLIFYGASVNISNYNAVPFLVWIICFLGAIQVFLLNVIAGGFKDIKNDYLQGANTFALRLGLQVKENKIYIPNNFKIIAYIIQLSNLSLAFLPFIFISNFASPIIFRYSLIFVISIISIFVILLLIKYLHLTNFERGTIRKLINLQGYLNFTLAPILLMTITPFAIIIVIIPGLGFFLYNIIFHEKFLEPSNM
ncbi:MAG: UbiA prenyltransferase family protein [Candidatus Hodarchaeota archaeon]